MRSQGTARGTAVAPRRGGLSLVEVMISLAICAMLLVAIAAAYSASAQAIAENDNFYRASQAARISMLQLQKAIRTCSSSMVGDPAAYDGTSTVVSSGTLHISLPSGQLKTYTYDPTLLKLKLYNTDAVTSTTPGFSLASNVSSVTFTADMSPNPANGSMRPARVTIDMTVTVGTDSVHLTTSAVPRYTVSY